MSSPIAVPNYPNNNLVPGEYFSISPINANSAATPQRTLVIGQFKRTTGVWAGAMPVLTSGVADIVPGAGGSNMMIARMIARYRKSDPTGEVWAGPIGDDAASTKTVVTVTFTGPATAAGFVALMISGEEVRVPVNSGDTATVIASNANSLINVIPDLPATSVAAAGVLTLTADNGGQDAGDMDVRVNYYGAAGGEALPAGVGVTIATTTQGTGNPVSALTTLISNLGNRTFDFIVCPYTDTASLNLIATLLNDTTGRWAWNQQLYGGAFGAVRGTVGQRATFAAARDDEHISYIGFYDSPTPAYEWAASYAGACAASLRVDPALPLGGMGDGVDLTVLAPPLPSQDIFSSQSTLLVDGMSTYLANAAGQVRVQRAVNSYTTNPAGQPDNSFSDVETGYTLVAAIRDLMIALSSQFARKKLVADGTPIPGGANFVTSQTILAAVIARYRLQCATGLCQNAAAFAAAAQANNAGNGLVQLFLPFQVANQLRVVAGSVAFSKP